MDRNNNEKKGFASSFNNKYFRIGGYSTLITGIVIVAAVVINLIVGMLPANITKLDTSDMGMYTLSEQTKEIVKAIEDNITIYHVAQSGAEDDTISELVDRYAAINSRIRVVKVDPVVNPNFTSKYTNEGVAENSLIVEGTKRFKIVKNSDIYLVSYHMDANYQMQTSSSFAGESAITSALDYVVSEVISKVYILTGHGETALSATMARYIADENIDTEELSLLLAGSVPEDATCLLINNPSADINSTEAEAILSYMKKGGSVIMTTTYSEGEANMPNLYGIGEYYGIKAHNGLVIEGSTNNYMQYPHFLIPKTGSHESIAALSESGFFTFMPFSMGLTAMDKMPRTTVTVTPLLYTTASAYLKTGEFENVEKADGDMKAEFMLGALATENNTKLLWYASPFIVDESADQLVAGGNSNFFIATLNWICGEGESVSIAAKTMQVAALMLTATESNLWSVVTIAVIPLLFAGFGLYVWMKRRKR